MTTTAESEQIRVLHDTVAPGIVRIGQHGGRGCGFVLESGVVVTNAHNLRDRTTEVSFADGRAVQARAVGIDPDGDLAVLEVDTGNAPALTWSEERARLGDVAYSVARVADGTRITVGTVSGADRSFRGPRGRRITGGVEHTAPLAKGSSGSALVDGEGRLVGISTLRLGDGFSIALAADAELRARVDELRSGVAPQRRLLGVAVAPSRVGRRLRRSVGLPDRDGVLVRHVEAGSPADAAGLRAGDLITSAAGTEILSADELAEALESLPDEGGSVELHVVRGGEELDVVATFGAAEDDGPTEQGTA